MGRYIDGQDRTQSVLFPERLDDWIDEGNPVRAVDVFVDALDLRALGLRAGAAGRDGTAGVSPGHAAQDLRLRLPESHPVQPPAGARNPAQRRADLADRPLTPDFKTIADFRRDNGEAIRKVCREFVLLCRQLKLFVDGDRGHRRQQVQGSQQPRQELHRPQAPRASNKSRTASSTTWTNSTGRTGSPDGAARGRVTT